MGNTTKSTVAEMWFDKAASYMDNIDSVTTGEIAECVQYCVMAIKNTESDEERKEMEARVDHTYALFTSKVLKKQLEKYGDDYDNFGLIGGVYENIFGQSLMTFYQEVGHTALYPVSHAKYYATEVHNFIKLAASKAERLKNIDVDQYVKQVYTHAMLTYMPLIATLSFIKDIYEETGKKIDYTEMDAAWWEVLNECRNVMIHAMTTAIELNPSRAENYRASFKQLEPRLANVISETRVAYEQHQLNERKKYYVEHPEELEKLKKELETISEELSNIELLIHENETNVENLVSKLTEKQKEEEKDFNEKVAELEKEMQSLGFFKMKEKSALKGEIANVEYQKQEMKKKYAVQISNERKPFEEKIAELKTKAEVLGKKKGEIEELL